MKIYELVSSKNTFYYTVFLSTDGRKNEEFNIIETVYKVNEKKKKIYKLPSMTESPRKNILLMNLSLLTGLAFLPLPAFGVSVHI